MTWVFVPDFGSELALTPSGHVLERDGDNVGQVTNLDGREDLLAALNRALGTTFTSISELLNILFPPSGAVKLTPDPEKIVRHPQGPAWVLAGPGSGKTEVLTVMALRLLYVDGDPAQSKRVPPEAVFITTFTA